MKYNLHRWCQIDWREDIRFISILLLVLEKSRIIDRMRFSALSNLADSPAPCRGGYSYVSVRFSQLSLNDISECLSIYESLFHGISNIVPVHQRTCRSTSFSDPKWGKSRTLALCSYTNWPITSKRSVIDKSGKTVLSVLLKLVMPVI